MEKTRVCKTCGKEKPISEFYVCYYRKDRVYYRSHCIECYKPKRNEHERQRRVTDVEFRDKRRATGRRHFVPGSRNEYFKEYRRKRKLQNTR